MSEFFLRSARLGFRRWREGDLPLAMKLWGDPAVTRYITSRGYTPREVQIRLELEIEEERAHGIQYWPFFLLATGEHIGCCGLRARAKEPDVPEFGVHVASPHWQQGYAFEAGSCVIAHAFAVRGARALFAGHNPENVASRHLLARLGFIYTHDEYYEPTGLQHPSYLLARAAEPRT
jgi:RimJ/RimL family protein N-acetyltransferase